MKYRAWFVNGLGHQFSRDFESSEALGAFIARSSRVGTNLIGFVSIERGCGDEILDQK